MKEADSRETPPPSTTVMLPALRTWEGERRGDSHKYARGGQITPVFPSMELQKNEGLDCQLSNSGTNR